MYRLNATPIPTANKNGLEFVMKVMAGDQVDIFGKSYYLNTAAVNNSNSTTLNLAGLFVSFLLAPSNLASTKGASAAILENINTGGVLPNTFFRGSNNEAPTTVPKAYINYIFFDEQFKYAGGGASRVGETGTVKDHWQADATLRGIVAPKNGYIFVYVSNESNLDVFFDNLQVIHKPGPILEETHYYPFGLTMAGISSKAAGKLENRYGFNGIEHTTEFDINMYDAFYRNLDPQIGRFWQVDPKPTDMESPYAVLGNNPIFNIDPLGDTVILSEAFMKNKAAMAGFELYKNTDAFKEQYGIYDIANGYAGGEDAGAQSANTNIVFDLFDDKAAQGNTSLTLANNDGKQQELWKRKLDKSAVGKETKAELRISLDPTIHTTKTGFAVGLNHEGSVHGTGMLKALSVLREKGGASFFDAWKQAATSPKPGDNLASFSSRYISNEFSHGQVGAGQNLQYNSVNTQIRNQLSPTERKTYDAKVSANIKTYSVPAANYRLYF